MGQCMNPKQIKTASTIPAEYRQDIPLGNDALQPLNTTLYNVLRKPSQVQIVRKGEKQIFMKESYPNLQSLKAGEIKILFSFKNLIIIGQQQELLNQIKRVSNPKSIYYISEPEALKFISKYPIFGAGEPINEPKNIPLLAIDSSEFVSTDKKQQVFLHLNSNQNRPLYQKLKITQIVSDIESLTPNDMGEELKKSTAQRILFSHSKARSQDDLLNILAHFAVGRFKVTSLGAKFYVRRCLPQTTITQPIPIQSQKNIITSSKSITGQFLHQHQVYQKYLKQIYSQMGGDSNCLPRIDRSYNLLITLLSNIYNNKEQDSYRRVKKTNPQIHDLLAKYKSGIKLMVQLGFKDDGSGYVNNLEPKYLKIYRTDLDLAYRNFIDSL